MLLFADFAPKVEGILQKNGYPANADRDFHLSSSVSAVVTLCHLL